MNSYVEEQIRDLQEADLDVLGRREYTVRCQRVSQCLEHCNMPEEQYQRALFLLAEKEEILKNLGNGVEKSEQDY